MWFFLEKQKACRPGRHGGRGRRPVILRGRLQSREGAKAYP